MAKSLLEHVLSASSFASPQGCGPILRMIPVLSLTGESGGRSFPLSRPQFPLQYTVTVGA